ncbi:uncharacterized protein LOC129896198 [Solanum dulcamara]|uniref:uncharacterized protein LOC129896198 n=1 Tax=Solanum dulcamara TaxID=45834 RepID=UPI002486CDEF|nr:uncharacterized protein LOC129896198 [Solanum dulcamara]
MKWFWRFNQEENPLWKVVVRSKPGPGIIGVLCSPGIHMELSHGRASGNYDSPKSRLHCLSVLARQLLAHSIQEGLAGLGVSRASNSTCQITRLLVMESVADSIRQLINQDSTVSQKWSLFCKGSLYSSTSIK